MVSRKDCMRMAVIVTALTALLGLGIKGIAQGQGVRKGDTRPGSLPQLPVEIPEFDTDKSEYVLLAWNDLGMHCITDAEKYWVFLPPANTIWAQLIKRGPKPELVTEGVELTYLPDPGFLHPERHVDFWKYASSLFGKEIPTGIGLAGKGVSGVMDLKAANFAFVAELIPLTPYPDDSAFLPYPLVTIEAKSKTKGEVLARTKMVAPVSSETSCRQCHGGPERIKGIAGLSEVTAVNVLKAHDELSKTDLLAQARQGKPKLCQSCHADPALGAAGKPETLCFSAAMHGWHATKIKGKGAEACNYCHPNASTGATRCLRDIHHTKELTCVDCHGNLEDHALSLLKKEQARGAKAAEMLITRINPRAVKTREEIKERGPWLNEPDCLTCHVDFQQPPKSPKGFNVWTTDGSGLYRMRSATGNIMCAACHGSPHAIYPAINPYGKDRDNIQPLQYQGKPYAIASDSNCAVCHKQAMLMDYHHPNSLGRVRNR